MEGCFSKNKLITKELTLNVDNFVSNTEVSFSLSTKYVSYRNQTILELKSQSARWQRFTVVN